jgi:Glycosyltransferase family 87
MWLYFSRVMVPHQRADAAIRQTPRGNLSDLYPRWLGSRELLLRRRNPYSPEVTREIQAGYYGRELNPSRSEDPKDQQAFAYPAYVAILLAPTVDFPFNLVRRGFECLLIALTGASVWLWLRVIDWRPKAPVWVMAMVLALGSFEIVQGIKLDQLSLLVAALIALSSWLLTRGRLFAAGGILALATIKPQLAAPIAGCLLVWVVADWSRRQRFVWGLGLVMFLLVAGAEVLLRGWIPKFWRASQEYLVYTGGISLLTQLLGAVTGKVASVVVLAMLTILVWRFREVEPGSPDFSLISATVLAATITVIPTGALYNHVVLLPALLLTAREWRKSWQRSALARATLLSTLVVVGWQWVGAMGLVFASLWISPEIVQRAWFIPLYTILVLPFVVLFQMVLLVREAWTRSANRGPQLAMADL